MSFIITCLKFFAQIKKIIKFFVLLLFNTLFCLILLINELKEKVKTEKIFNTPFVFNISRFREIFMFQII